MLAAITMCTPYWYHRQGTREGQGVRAELPPRGPLARARELALGETNTDYRAWECTYRITSRREQLRGARDSFAFLPRDFRSKPGGVLTRDGDVRELRARATAGAERVRRIWLRRPGANYELQYEKLVPLVTHTTSLPTEETTELSQLFSL
jgi:hypothetical protein